MGRGLPPNAAFRAPAVAPPAKSSLVQQLLEMPLRGRRGDWLENRARKLAVARLAAHHRAQNQSVPRDVEEQLLAGVELRFHGSPAVEGLMARYEARRAEVAESLRRNREWAATGAACERLPRVQGE